MANTQGRFRANSGLLKWQTLNKQNYLFFDNRSQKCRLNSQLFWLVIPAYLPLRKLYFFNLIFAKANE